MGSPRRPALLLLLAWLAGAVSAHAETTPHAADAARRLYREGVDTAGTPVLAAGPAASLLGAQAACARCHGRSGLGTRETTPPALPVAGRFLFLRRNQPLRSAYTQESLARALRDGIDPDGRALDPHMPRYRLSDPELAALTAYLKTLSAGHSPGVSADTLTFATVVTADADPESKQAVLDVLQAYVRDKNRATRHEVERGRISSGYGGMDMGMDTQYRAWQLEVWTLEGPPLTWPGQLEAHYARKPVFALVSGLAQEWAPVHAFCEEREIPCLLPNTNLPPASEGFYSLYFSAELRLEAAIIAAQIRRRGTKDGVLQLQRAGPAAEAARALAEAVPGRVSDWALEGGSAIDEVALSERLAKDRPSSVVAWLGGEDLLALGRVLARLPSPPPLYLSSTLAESAAATLPEPVRRQALMAEPSGSKAAPPPGWPRFLGWMRTRQVALTHPRLQGRTFFACISFQEGLMRSRGQYLREYLLEVLETTRTLAQYSPIHPRLSFEPGRRQLQKGGYLIALGAPTSTVPEWVVP